MPAVSADSCALQPFSSDLFRQKYEQCVAEHLQLARIDRAQQHDFDLELAKLQSDLSKNAFVQTATSLTPLATDNDGFSLSPLPLSCSTGVRWVPPIGKGVQDRSTFGDFFSFLQRPGLLIDKVLQEDIYPKFYIKHLEHSLAVWRCRPGSLSTLS